MGSALNAVTLALIDAGLPMRDFVTACEAGYIDGHVLVDLNALEASGRPPLCLSVCHGSCPCLPRLAGVGQRLHLAHLVPLVLLPRLAQCPLSVQLCGSLPVWSYARLLYE